MGDRCEFGYGSKRCENPPTARVRLRNSRDEIGFSCDECLPDVIEVFGGEVLAGPAGS